MSIQLFPRRCSAGSSCVWGLEGSDLLSRFLAWRCRESSPPRIAAIRAIERVPDPHEVLSVVPTDPLSQRTELLRKTLPLPVT